MRYTVLILLFLAFVSCSNEQVQSPKKSSPKLIVGIIVDQMRFDYLARFENKFSETGFRRLLKSGFHFDSHYFSSVPTYTAPGHATIFTGVTPNFHGIVANDWWVKSQNEMTYCVFDSSVSAIGRGVKKQKRSPENLTFLTLGDHIKTQTNQLGKTIGVSLKDRSAILPVGKTADAAYWFEGGDIGSFVSSSYYHQEMPLWVQEFNDLNLADSYLNKTWETLLPKKSYTECDLDDSPYEESIDPNKKPVFPYDLSQVRKHRQYDLIKRVPFGNDLLLDFSMAAIENEGLGEDEVTDLLSISFSATDYIGHDYGPNSMEIEDTYLRLDVTISELLNYLDEKVGTGQYLVFLTSDHGVATVPQQLTDQGKAGGYYDQYKIKNQMAELMEHEFGYKSLIHTYYNNQFYLNLDLMEAQGINAEIVTKFLKEEMIKLPGVTNVYSPTELNHNLERDTILSYLKNGFDSTRSGELLVVMESGWLPLYNDKITGSDHGSHWDYDTHIPLIFYGQGIPSGSSNKRTHPEDIVPTILDLMEINSTHEFKGLSRVNLLR